LAGDDDNSNENKTKKTKKTTKMRPLPRATATATTALASGGSRRVAAAASASASVCAAAGRRRRALALAAAASSSSSSSSSAAQSASLRALSGTWHRATERHDVDGLMELWGLPAIARATAKKIKGFEIEVVSNDASGDGASSSSSSSLSGDNDSSSSNNHSNNHPHLSVRYLCPVPQFSVREVVPLGPEASPARLRRRDLKPGGSWASAAALPGEGGPRVRVTTRWEGCEMEETYEIAPPGEGGGGAGGKGGDPDTLLLRTTLRCRRRGGEGGEGERTAHAVQVYKRRSS
jgi:hypothetical protein